MTRIEQIGRGKAMTFRLGSSSFVLVWGCGSEVVTNIVEHSVTHPFVLDLGTGNINRLAPGSTQSDCFPVGESVLALLMQHWRHG